MRLGYLSNNSYSLRRFRQERICQQCGRFGYDPWIGMILWRREWQPTPIFLPGESHGQRSSLVGYSPWGRKESDTTEWLKHTHTHTHTHVLSGKKELASLKGRTVAVWKERDYWFSVHYYKIAIWKQVKSASQHHWAPIRLSSEVSKMSIRKHTSLPDGGHGLTQNRKMLW